MRLQKHAGGGALPQSEMAGPVGARQKQRRAVELRLGGSSVCVECERAGGVNLSQGVCDLIVPEPVRRAAKHAIDNGPNSYSRHDGAAEMREAIALSYRRRTGLNVDPEKEVVVSGGATGALYCACLALLEPGDEVILFEPYYSYHESTLVATGAVPVFVSTKAPEWTIDFDDLAAAISERTRAPCTCTTRPV